jgi:hypothetical protein
LAEPTIFERRGPVLNHLRGFLGRNVFSLLDGATFGNWWRLARHNRFAVDVPYWPRALFLTSLSFTNSLNAMIEQHSYGRQIDATRVKPPLFILGHYRSGTTHLHNLLSLDSHFAYPTLLQVLYPHTFLTTGAILARAMNALMLHQRPQDNMTQGVESPSEDEFALCSATSLSPYMGWVFPRNSVDYDRYLTFRGVPEDELARWKAAIVWFLKKLTLVSDRPLLLKSPPHTARIRLLLELFPEARFVHIHRNPYTVYQSTKHTWQTCQPYWRLQRSDDRNVDQQIIDTYNKLYDAFFEERALIPRGQFCEVPFESLEREPLQQLERIYETLSLSGFPSLRTSLDTYLRSIEGYRKNEYAVLPDPLQQRISSAWARSFEEWKYAV